LKTEREHEDEDSEEEKHGFAMVKVSPSSSSQEIQMPSSFEECTAPFMPQTPSPNLSEPCPIPKGVSFDSPYINSVYPSPPLSTTVDGLFDLSKTLPGSPSSRCEPYHQQRQKRKLQSERQRHHSRRKAQSQQRFLAQQSSTMMPGYTLLPTSSSVVSNLWSSSQYWPDSTRTTGTSLHPSEPVCSETLPISNGTFSSILSLVFRLLTFFI
jgi:hypothetical protein